MPKSTPMTDLLELIFDINTYHGAVISRPPTKIDVLFADRVKGTDLRVKFERRLHDWDVEVIVSVMLAGKQGFNQREWVPICTGVKVTPEIKRMWSKLNEISITQELNDDEIRQEAIGIFHRR